MTTKTKKVLQSALELSPQQRAILTVSLLESLKEKEEEDREDVQKAWAKEIRRRLKEIDEGNAEMMPWEEVREELRAMGHAKEN